MDNVILCGTLCDYRRQWMLFPRQQSHLKHHFKLLQNYFMQMSETCREYIRVLMYKILFICNLGLQGYLTLNLVSPCYL